MDQERNEFDVQNAQARSEIAVINDEIAYKQQKIDDSLRNLNFDLQRYEKNNELLDSEREKLQTEVKVLRQEQFDLENRKKLFEFEQQQG